MRVGLESGDESVDPEGDDASADPGDTALFPDALPDQLGAADLSDGSQYEQWDRAHHVHAEDPVRLAPITNPWASSISKAGPPRVAITSTAEASNQRPWKATWPSTRASSRLRMPGDRPTGSPPGAGRQWQIAYTSTHPKADRDDPATPSTSVNLDAG